jgi:hypothetical protein
MDENHYPVSPFFYGKRIINNINANNNNNNNNSNNSNNVNVINECGNKVMQIQNAIQTQLQTQMPSHLSINKMGSHNVLIRNKSPPNLPISPTRTSSSESMPSSPNAFNRALLQHFQLNNACIENAAELQQPMLTNYLNSLSNHWKVGETGFNNNTDLLKHGLHLPPPPEYERQWSNSSPNSVSTSASNSTTPECNSVERLAISRSHPDLSKFDDQRDGKCNDLNSSNSAIPKYNMIDMLTAENAALKTELELYYKKVLKLQKVIILNIQNWIYT